jgi:hypothetical protein
MARINIEESIWGDAKFMNLCISLGDPRTAIGAVVMAWKTAQKYWYPDKKPIPKEEWIKAGIGTELIECGLARETDYGIYVNGAEHHFAWWFEQRHTASVAGTKSAAARKKKFGSAIPVNASNSERKPNGRSEQIRTEPNDSERSSSSSSSSSNSKTNIRLKGSTDCVSEPPDKKRVKMAITAIGPQNNKSDAQKASRLMAAYINAYKARYSSRPACVDDRKTWGRVTQFVKDRPIETCEHLVQVYLQLDDPWFNLKFHDLETFFQNVNKVSTALQSGKDPSKPKTTAEVLAELDLAEEK